MILWRKNIVLDTSIHNKLQTELKSEIFYHKGIDNLYTSYNKQDLFDKTGVIGNYYNTLISDVMIDLSLYERTSYIVKWWAQLYNSNTTGHGDHDHFSGYEHVSWIHFVSTPAKQKCFYFSNDKNEKHYIDHQSSGDFIVFPSWAKHGVDKVVDDNFDRLVVAGNVEIQSFHICKSDSNYKLTLQPPKRAHQNLIVWRSEKI